MPIIPDNIRQQVTDLFSSKLSGPVTVRLFTRRASALTIPGQQDCETCPETTQLVQEVCALSDKITLQVHDVTTKAEEARKFGISDIPALVFQGKNKGVLRYFGMPAGSEFGVLVQAIADVSSGEAQVPPAMRQQLETLPGPVHIQVMVTPT